MHPMGSTCSSMVLSAIRTFGLASAGNLLRSSPPSVLGAGLSQSVLSGMTAPEIKYPFG